MGRLRKDIEAENKLFSDSHYFVNNPILYKGNWNVLFKNNNPIEIEIGSGKGRFIFEKAKANPNINYIAIDKFPTILFKLLNKLYSLDKKIDNIKILSMDVMNICDVFKDNEIDKIYLNFSDPWPKKHHERFRLTSPNFVSKFFKVLKNKQPIEFKTDNKGLFDYTMDKIVENNFNVVMATNNLYMSDYCHDNVPTEYEIKWINKGANIKKVIFYHSK